MMGYAMYNYLLVFNLFRRARWVKFGGTKIKCNAIMHICFDTNDMPKLWKIHKMAIIEKNLSARKFVVEPIETITFDHHF